MKKVLIATAIIFMLSTSAFAQSKVLDPTVTKTVEEAGSWVKERNAKTNDIVRFRLIGKLPSNWEEREEYRYEFVDTLPEGEEYRDDATVIYAGDKNIDITDSAQITILDNTLTIAFADLKSVLPKTSEDDKIIVYYTTLITKEAPADLINYVRINYDELVASGTGFMLTAMITPTTAETRPASSVTDKATVHLKAQSDPAPGKDNDPGTPRTITQKIAKMVKTGDAAKYLVLSLLAFLAGLFIGTRLLERRSTKHDNLARHNKEEPT